jgi:hypothetical protein
MVYVGEKDVCSAAIEDAGDWRFRSFDLSLRRNLWGTRSCIDRHGTWKCDFKNVPCCPSFHGGKVVDIPRQLLEDSV